MGSPSRLYVEMNVSQAHRLDFRRSLGPMSRTAAGLIEPTRLTTSRKADYAPESANIRADINSGVVQ